MLPWEGLQNEGILGMKIGILGCAGRMGRMLLAEVMDHPQAVLAGGSLRPGHASLSEDLGLLAGRSPLGQRPFSSADALFAASDVVIDFTLPAGVAEHARLARESGTALVMGVTGLGRGEQAALEQACQEVPLVQAANMSLGVNLLLALVEQAAARLSEDFDIEILEMHHRHKLDAPSGTALALGEAAAKGRGRDLAEVAQRVRDGHTGERRRGDIGFATLRGGSVVGEHQVIYASSGERLELGHRAASRAVFAQGAVAAALWCAGKPAGHYSMRDVLNL